MDIGNEISQKIRAAIKAKLVDLGAYVDDELPDYIMVMVANKKSQSQMTEDLNLFLGHNTETFTSWLSALLNKLKSISAGKKGEGGAEGQPGAEEAVADQPKAEGEAPKAPEAEAEPEEPEAELTIRPHDEDEFEEEAQTDEKKGTPKEKPKVTYITKTVSKPVSEPAAKVTKPSPGTKKKSEESTKKTPETKSKVSSSKTSKTRRDSGSSKDAKAAKEPTASISSKEGGSRKRRAPSSTIGAVKLHSYSDEEEEEYDPQHPLIGKVASTIKVGRRRPTVPPAKQANKNLLMKAMSEAETSIEKSTKRARETVKDSDRHSRMRSDAVMRGSPDHSPPRSSRGSSRSIAPLRARRTSPRRTSPRRSTPPVELTSRSKRQEVMGRLKYEVDGDKDRSTSPHRSDDEGYDPDDKRLIKREFKVTHSGDEDEDSAEQEDSSDVRTISIHKKIKVEAENDDDKDTEDDGGGLPELSLLVESGAEESDFTDGEEDNAQEEPRKIVQKRSEERSSSPKFVVTLDGIDPELMKKDIVADEDLEMAGAEPDDDHIEEDAIEISPQGRNIVRVKPQRFRQEVDDEEEEDGPSIAKRSKMGDRCRFWPACANGNSCPYMHPSIPCKAFPRCKFGDKCFYIHPNCKFDAACTRPNCPFTHATRRSRVPQQPSVIIQPVRILPVSSGDTRVSVRNPEKPPKPLHPSEVTCKFFPKCTNMSCPFRHPTPCRYGVGCMNKDSCPYTHPALPSKDKLRWINKQGSQSGTDAPTLTIQT